MCTNVLHQRVSFSKDETCQTGIPLQPILGKCGTHCITIPESNFTYGIKSIKKTDVSDGECVYNMKG